jgi:hypothetical protein
VRAAQRPLENVANKGTPPSRREVRWELLRLLWDVSQNRRVRSCRRSRIADVVGVRWGGEGAGAGFSGLATCGSVWACPIDSAKIMARRSLEIGAGLLTWENRGGRLLMGTLTMRHNRGHALASEWDALRDAFASIRKSRVWKKWLGRLGSPGYVLVVEVTYGEHGWHVHLHFVLLVDGGVNAADVLAFRSWLFAKWGRCLQAVGMPGALAAGQDVHLVEGVAAASELGGYLAKSTAYGAAESLGRELMGTWTKKARGTHATEPAWRLAEQFGTTGDMELLELWHEYERGSKGRRQCTWSRGLRQLLDLGAEQTDEAIAAEQAGDTDLVQITSDGWESVLAARWPASRILDAVEAGGVAGLRQFLDAHGVDYLGVE